MDCVEADGKGLEEGALYIRDRGRQLVAHRRRVVRDVRQGAVEVWIRLCGAAEDQRAADVVPALRAERAIATRYANFEGDSVTWFQRRHAYPDSSHCASGFMAQDERGADNEVTVSAVVIVMEVGATKAGCTNGYLDLVGSRGIDFATFLDERLSTRGFCIGK